MSPDKPDMPLLYYCMVLVISFLCCGDVKADIYRFRDESGAWHFSNIKSDTRYRIFIRTSNMPGNRYIINYSSIINEAAGKYDVDAHLIKAVIMAESSFDPNAVSKKGARGLMQLMPETAVDMQVEDPFDPEENIFGGTKYLRQLLETFNHDKKLALAAYNAGPKRVKDYNSVPPISETEHFVGKVLKYYRKFREKQ